MQGASVVAPAGMTLKLQSSPSRYVVTDDQDNIESYDTSGRLLSITNRFGVVTIMTYDSSGWLGGVIDSLGHQLILTYNSQGRLSTVTHQ